jgi:hypothetical protein
MSLIDFGSNTLFLGTDPGVPPFNVLDARQGYWTTRKRLWTKLGTDGPLLKSGMGRSNTLIGGRGSIFGVGKMHEYYRVGGQEADTTGLEGKAKEDYLRRYKEESVAHRGSVKDEDLKGTSIFDPVLAEILYRWYCPEGGRVLDPFAGGSVRGVVAALLGRAYVGVDLSEEQVGANREQAAVVCKDAPTMPEWVRADSCTVETWIGELSVVSADPFDFLLSCPPYYNLEQYTDDKKDISNAGTYEQFVESLGIGLGYAARRLADDSFAAVVVGDLRDERGMVRTFPEDTMRAMTSAGMDLYCRAVLVTSAGTLPLRAARSMKLTRKLGQTFQWVLVFVKGDPKAAAVRCGAETLGPGTKSRTRITGKTVRGAPLELSGPIEQS